MKRLFSTITALAMAVSLCMSALPVYAEGELDETPVCTCTEQCTEGAVNDACPVCTADLTQCAGKAAEPEKEPEEPQAPECTCTEQCTEGAVNDACPVCTADLTQCAGKAAEPEEPQAPETREEQENTPVTQSEEGEHGAHEGYISLQDALDSTGYTLDSGTYYLADDVKLGQYSVEEPTQYILTVKGDVTLCLNGHVLDLSENHIEVLGADSSLTICDCQPEAEHKFRYLDSSEGNKVYATYVDNENYKRERSHCWMLDPDQGTEIVRGGVITNGDRSYQIAPEGDSENKGKGGAIYVKDGSFTLESGNLVGNAAGWVPHENEYVYKAIDGYGGAVYVENGTFTMTGGRIAGNKTAGGEYVTLSPIHFYSFTSYGGAVYLRNSKGVMTGGMIDNNRATSNSSGGAVCADEGSSFTMENGSIAENTLPMGGVAALNNSTFLMNDGEIRENVAGGTDFTAGVTVHDNSVFELHNGKIINNQGTGVSVKSKSKGTMYDGTISGNVGESAGGLSVAGIGTSFVMKNGTVSHNIGADAGGVDIGANADFTMEGGVISENKNAPNAKPTSVKMVTGGINVDMFATATITGGQIINNEVLRPTATTTHGAGGITVSGTLNLLGGKIAGNVSKIENDTTTPLVANGIHVWDSAVLNLSGAPEIASTDDVALAIEEQNTPDAENNAYINVDAAYTGSDSSPVNITPILEDNTPVWLEEPTADTGTRLVVFTDAAGGESAAAAADKAKWFAPSTAMLAKEPTLEVGQSHPQKTWLTFVKYADIAPAGMIIYVGGQGYTGVVDDSGTTVGTSNGFPVPGFTVAIPEVTSIEADKLGLQYHKDETSLQWIAQLYGKGATSVYRFVPAEGTGNTPVRIQFLHQDGDTQTVVDSDDFVVTDYLDQTLRMRVYGEGIEQDYVTLQYNGRGYYIRTKDSELTIRSTTDHVQYGNVNDSVEQDKPGLSAPIGTVYTINDSNVQVTDTTGVALLFDDIIENNTNPENKSNTQLLRDKTDDVLAEMASPNLDEGKYRHYECKYLDLVDTKNGNAWLKASNDVTVYWPLPEDTNASTKFELLHFTDLHRDMGVSEIENKIDTCVVERVDVQVKDNHIVFTTDGFSPFVLVWQTDTSTSQGDLVVSKTVAGSQGETDRLFNFTVTLGDSSIQGWYGGMEFTDGVATFQLSDNGRMMAEGLPAGISYTVTEKEANQDGYTTTITTGNATGRITSDAVTTVAFTNTKEPAVVPGPEKPTTTPDDTPKAPETTPAPAAPAAKPASAAVPAASAAPAAVIPQTGDESEPMAWAALMGLSAMALIALAVYRRKRSGK